MRVLLTCPLLLALATMQGSPCYAQDNSVLRPPAPPTPLHFVWVNPYLELRASPGLARASLVAQNWLKILPHMYSRRYKLMFWTDRKVRAEFPDLVPMLSKVPVSSWLSDVIRYHAILRYGGVYLDTDTQAVHNFTPLLDMFNSSWTVCQTPWIKPDTKTVIEPLSACESVACGMIAAPPGHPALLCAAEKSLAYTVRAVHGGTVHAFDAAETGPVLWTQCVRDHPGITVLPSWTFLPCDFWARGTCNTVNYEEFPNVYGMHEWMWSWRDQLKFT
jgi:hypothetical protein